MRPEIGFARSTVIGAKVASGRATFLGQFDLGTQGKSARDGGSASWYGLTAIARAQLTPTVALSGRVERFDDEDQVIIATGTSDDGSPNGAFRANGGSVGLDITPQARLLWRTELRGFSNKTAIFPDGKTGAPQKGNAFVVSSLAVTLTRRGGERQYALRDPGQSVVELARVEL